MRTEIPVAVLKLNPNPLHSGTLGIVRSLGRLGVDVHVLGDPTSAPVARSRYVRSVVPLPQDAGTPAALAEWMTDGLLAGRPLLVAADDRAASFVQSHADRLVGSFRFDRLPEGLVADLCDKATLADLATAAGVPTPVNDAPATEAELDDFASSCTFPVVVKARDPELLRRTPQVASVEIAEDCDQLDLLWHHHLVDGRPNCVLQEYIPGGPETVWMINGYVDERSELVYAATGRKLRQFPAYTGATSLGVCECN